MTTADAANVLLELKGMDRWDGRHDEAAGVLGLDPDNYRARDNANWPENMRGRVTEPNLLHRHAQAAADPRFIAQGAH